MDNLRYAGRRAILGLSLAAGGLIAIHPRAVVAGKAEEKEVGAVEDLMREHGVLRRALLVYSETATKLRGNTAIDPKPIQTTAQLFRSFGEDYHEQKLEEAHIFPMVAKTGGPAATLVDTLKQQHDRGREITAYILSVTGKGAIGTGDVEPMARAFETFVLMYRNHAAREDTVVFPAWKEALSARQLREMGDKFENIERQQFGHDGFEDAVKQMAQIEQALGFADLAQFTAPAPPKT
ncbi:MAG: hemerythrin domain-containing protein [Alphaproteobacteria bacterium]|nr:hemerythrin domain-containing protein [Alphaproteobacteria bacterium]